MQIPTARAAPVVRRGHRREAASALRALALAASFAAGLLSATAAAAAERQSIESIRAAVQTHLRRETTGLPGEVGFSIGAIDPRLNLAHCASLETFPAPGAPAWGATTVGVRCRAGEYWTVYVPVTVNVVAEYAVTSRPIAQGQTLGPGDVTTRRGDLAHLPAGVIVDPRLAYGKQSAIGIAPGQPLRQEMLRAPLIIQQGQEVRVVSRGPGFQVSVQGRAVTAAREGQTVQVRTPAGPVVSGVARPGPLVEIASGG